jgi:hypothetical protein
VPKADEMVFRLIDLRDGQWANWKEANLVTHKCDPAKLTRFAAVVTAKENRSVGFLQ